ncbi:effector-associated constant component EACC1 [Streptomyces sp. Tue6028]|uniref:effector-associated constant component EACC1 n=1 Tax=Streptomyces sp. Tue6028 TaxID=2036037 RepID=UPI003EBF64E8
MTLYRLAIAAPDHAGSRSLQQLAEWLRGDEQVGDHAEVDLVAAPVGESDMGSAFDAVQVVMDEGFQLANFILAIATWRRTAPAKPGVVIERNGIRVTVDTDDPEKIAQIAEALSDAS